MSCIICSVWDDLPYKARWSTPTTPQETEGALLLGYALGLQNNPAVLAGICNQHVESLRQYGALNLQPKPEKAVEPEHRGLFPSRVYAMLQATKLSIPQPTVPTVQLQLIPCAICGTMVGRGEMHICPEPDQLEESPETITGDVSPTDRPPGSVNNGPH